jgi:hypothetical protein
VIFKILGFLRFKKQAMDEVQHKESSNIITSPNIFKQEQTVSLADKCNNLIQLSEFLENTLVLPFCKPNDQTGACQLLLLPSLVAPPPSSKACY